jgi:hypothetical protein
MSRRTALALAAALALALPAAGRAQFITFDSASTGQLRATNTLSWSHSVGAGNNRLLVVGIGTEDNPAVGDSAVVSISYSGIALARVPGAQQRAVDTGVNSENYTDLWFLLNPPVGTGTITVNVTGTVADLLGGGASFHNVLQQPPEAVGGAATSTTNFSSIAAPITTLTPGALVVDVGLHSTSNGTMTPGMDQIEAWDQSTAGARTAFSYRLVPTPGTVTDSWTADGNPLGRMAISVAAFAQVPEPSFPLLTGMGVLLFAAWRRRRSRGMTKTRPA